jgi:hypothetical protein
MAGLTCLQRPPGALPPVIRATRDIGIQFVVVGVGVVLFMRDPGDAIGKDERNRRDVTDQLIEPTQACPLRGDDRVLCLMGRQIGENTAECRQKKTRPER